MSRQISVNPKHRADPSQRYMMPVFDLRYQGKNQNTKTCLENLDAVSAKLRRPPSTIHKFFGLKFNTRLDEKAGKFFLRGTYTLKELQPALDNYIEDYVLCGTCGNPETKLLLDTSKKSAIIRDCGACGNRSDVKGDEKMLNALVKDGAVTVTGEKKKVKKKKSASSGAAAAEEEDDGVTWSASVSKEAKDKRRAELLGKTTAQEIEDLLKKGELAPEPYVALQKKEGWSDARFANELVAIAFDSKIYSQLDARKPLLEKLTADKPELQLGLIQGVSVLATKTFPHLKKSLDAIFQKMYTQDLIGEEAFLAWSKDTSPEQAEGREAAAKFLAWLTTPPAEGDEE